MKKLALLFLAPAMILTSCGNKAAAMKRYKGAAQDNNYGVEVGDLRFNISSGLGVDWVYVEFAIENEGAKDLHFKFKDSYLKIEGEEQKYEIHFIDGEILRKKVELDEIDVPADSSVSMIAETNDLGSATLQGRTVIFHTVLNGKYSFTISNMCEDLR